MLNTIIPQKLGIQKKNAMAIQFANWHNCTWASPYLWGGRSFFGIDCSGLVQVVFKMCDINFPRDSAEQANFGQTISFIDDALPGDLAFFDNEENKIIHVGILLGNNQIIHASGEVRIDKIDHFGIYNEKEKKYSHKLRIIKRPDEFIV